MEKRRMRHGIEKAINEINENDFRVRVLGTVKGHDSEKGSCEIDDGTGTVLAFFEGPGQMPEIEDGGLLRIIGKVRKKQDESERTGIDVEIAQDMNAIDMELLEKTSDVLENLRY